MRFKLFSNFLLPDYKSASLELVGFWFISVLASCCVLFLPTKMTLAVILIIIFALFSSFMRIHILQIFMITLILGPAFFSNDMSIFILLYNAFFAILIFYYFASKSLRGKLHERVSNHYTVVILLLLFGFFAFISIVVNTRFTERSILETIRYFSLAPLFLLLYFFVKDRFTINKIVITVIFISFTAAIYSYWLAFSMGLRGFIIYGITSLHATYSALGNANSLAMFIGYSIPILISYLLFGKGKIKRPYVLLGVLFLFVIWLLCNSRSSYVYLFFSILFLVSFHKKGLKYLSAIFIVVIICGLFLSSLPFVQNILRIETGLSLRDELWKTAGKIIEKYPIFGTGPASYDEVKFYYMVPNKARDIAGTTLGGGAHNLILTKASELGFGAVFVIFVFWYLVISNFLKNEKYMRSSNYHFLYLASGAIFIGLIFRSIFEIGNMIGNGRLNENILTLFFVVLIYRLPTLKNYEP